MTLKRALLITAAAEGVETEFTMRPRNSTGTAALDSYVFHLRQFSNDEWVEVCRGTVITEHADSRDQVEQPEAALALEETASKFWAGAARCQKTVESKRLYQNLDSFGFSFGPAFQTLHEACWNDYGEALATIRLHEWAQKVKDKHVQPHVIHPVPLDGIFHLVVVALSKGGWEKIPTYVPTRVQEVWVSHDLLKSATSAALKVYARRTFSGWRDEEFSIIAVDAETGQPKVTADGYRGTAVSALGGGSSIARETAARRRICFEIDWKPDIDLLPKRELAQYCLRADSPPPRPSPEEVHLAEILCLFWMARALESATDGDIPGPHLRRYASWMRHHLALPESQARLASPEAIRIFRDAAYRDAITQPGPPSVAAGELYTAVGEHLPQILRGEVDVLSLLFDSRELAAQFYQSAWLSAGNASMARYLDLLAHKDSSRLHVLEVGAGTGSATAPILAALAAHGPDAESGTPRLASYTYTDISAGFFEAARERLVGDGAGDRALLRDRLRFATLDIGADPAAQGFADGAYDVVVAAHVLHATPRLAETLRHVRRLLRPGGRLVLAESTNLTCARVSFVFGTLPGWWLAEEEERRLRPLLSCHCGHDMLRAHGFSGADLVLQDGEGLEHTMSVIVAEAIPRSNDGVVAPLVPGPGLVALSSGATGATGVVIVADDADALQKSVADDLVQTCCSRSCNTVSPSALASIDLHGASCLFLPELTRSFLGYIRPDELSNLKRLVSTASSVLWVSSGGGETAVNPMADLATGFGRSMCSEQPGLRFSTLALEYGGVGATPDKSLSQLAAETIWKVFSHLSSLPPGTPHETEYIQRDGQLHIGRLIEAHYLNDHIHLQSLRQGPRPEAFGGGSFEGKSNAEDSHRALSLVIGSPGQLDTLHFVHDPHHAMPLAEDEVEVRVHASSLNFKDVMIAMGQLPSQHIGSEFAGVITRLGPSDGDGDGLRVGDRVCGITLTGSFKTYARTAATCVAHIPPGMSFTEAACFPVAYVTAYHALADVARLRAGETVLVHAAAGGVGQAAVQLARRAGARVLGTVGSAAKRDLLVGELGVDPDDVFSSRKLSFARGVRRRTGGRGVDVVLNSLAGDALRESWRCVAPMGRFVEIGKQDALGDEGLPMEPFARGATFAAVDLALVVGSRERSVQARDYLRQIMAWVQEGWLKAPTPLHAVPVGEIESAFRGLQGGKLAGKVVVEMNGGDVVSVVPAPQTNRIFDPHACYVISGGLGGLGRSIVRWMVTQGVRHLILLSRSGLTTPAACALADELAQMSVHVAAPACDVSDENALRSALTQCAAEGMPPIKGCIQGSMVLRDSLFENMSHADFHAALRPKVQASWNLHNQLPVNLVFFIMLSSVGGIFGNRGQSNYVAGNTYQDALARHRLAKGLPAVSIDVGMMLQVGFLAEGPGKELLDGLVAAGGMGMYEAELHAILHYYCDPDPARRAVWMRGSPFRGQIPTGIATPAALRRRGIDGNFWMHRPMFRHLHQMDLEASADAAGTAASSKEAADVVDYGSVLSGASLADAVLLVETGLVRKLARALSIPERDIDPALPASAAGVDSLVAIEIKYWFLKEIHAEVAVFNILGNDDLHTVCQRAMRRSPLWKGEGSGADGEDRG